MSNFFTAPDAADEPTIWERIDGDPRVVVRRVELFGPHADLLWRVLTGVLCADDETVERVARAMWRDIWPSGNGPEAHWEFTRKPYIDKAGRFLTALRGEQ